MKSMEGIKVKSERLMKKVSVNWRFKTGFCLILSIKVLLSVNE